jgi:hypothetical protein
MLIIMQLNPSPDMSRDRPEKAPKAKINVPPVNYPTYFRRRRNIIRQCSLVVFMIIVECCG